MDDQSPNPTPAVHDASLDLVRAAALFMGAADAQYATLKPDDHAALNAAVADGNAAMVVVVSIAAGSWCAQLCADVGTERAVIASVPISQQLAPLH